MRPLPMPAIIYRYLLMEIMPPFGASLLAFTTIVFLGRLMKVTQMIVVKGVGLVEVLKTCAYLFPYLLVFTLPMAATVGIMLALMRLSVDQEVIALKTAGLSYAQLLPPIFVFSLATAILALFLTGYGSPWGQKATRQLMMEVVKRRADLGIKEQVFNTDFQDLMLFVNRVPSATGQLEGIFIYDYRDKDNPNTVYAHKGQLSFDESQETLMLHLADGRVIRWGPALTKWQTVEFKTYQLPLQLFSALKEKKSEDEMYLGELWGNLDREPRGSEQYIRLAVELSRRFSLPCGAFLLCLIAMPLGMSPRHHGRTWGLILGLVVFLVYYIVFTASWRLAMSARLNPSLAPWISNLLFTGVALYLWRRTVRELPLLPVVWPHWREHLQSIRSRFKRK
ncbi:MAG: LPS export ABC transporter permease LptF [Deltaproteobacteria bacterium RBG_13_60_28]|nr:MAG: LPS export ABC transporter permease LptF [Deltaproteobacteria bacterium RBG_13_60_28]